MKSFTSLELRMQCGSGELQEIISLNMLREKVTTDLYLAATGHSSSFI